MSTNFTQFLIFNFYLYLLMILLINISIFSCKNDLSTMYEEKANENQNNQIIEINLLTFSGLYFINVNMGYSRNQRFELMIDTQHKQISVMSQNCTACKDLKVFDESSESFQVERTNQTIQMNNYEFHGRDCSDGIELEDKINLSRYHFFLVDEVTRTTSMKFQGYFGLGFTKNKEENFVYHLKENGIISDAVYSILILPLGEDSKLYLGGYDKKLINDTDADKIIYTDIAFNEDPDNTQVEWYIPTESIFINNNLIDKEQRIVLNSASNIIRIPKNFFFQNIKSIFHKESQCQMWTDNVFHCRCDTDYQTIFPTFKFQLSQRNYNLTITPDDYTVLDNSLNLSSDSSAYCLLYISLNYNNDYWLLGNNFINNFYTIYDVENSRIGFYDMRNINVPGIQDILMLSIIIISSSVLFFFIIYCVYQKYMARANRTEQLLPN